MANVYGRMQGFRYSGYPRNEEVTRCGDGAIEANLETWEGKVSVYLRQDGQFSVEIGPKHGRSKEIVMGNVGNDGRYYLVTEDAAGQHSDPAREEFKRVIA